MTAKKKSPAAAAAAVLALVVLGGGGTVPLAGLSERDLPAPRPGLGGASLEQAVPRRAAVEIPVPATESDEAVLGRPIALAFDDNRLLIADALDCAVKIFSRDGAFLGSFGRKGAGPGELSFPSGICVAGQGIVVADKINFRIQTFDRQGRPRGGFKVPFPPDRVFALDAGRILVTANPTGRTSAERLLRAFEADGRPAWEGLEARTSADPVLDAFRNMILVCPGDEDDLYVVFRSGERMILRFSGSGDLLDRIAVDERYAFRTVDLPSGKGRMRLDGFCWAAARDEGLFYLSAPDAPDGRDLGPGRYVSILDGQGRLRAIVDLPCAVHRFLVAGGRMFAVDEEGSLRIFEVGR